MLDLEVPALSDFEVLHVAGPHVNSTARCGSRIVFDEAISSASRLAIAVG